MKDPAFLFYSKDYYEGTRTMLPEERACLVDLLIYQHQNGGFIPNDLRRLRMYCSGIDAVTLETTLKAKFKLTNEGWHNQKMQTLSEERSSFKGKQSINGKVGNFFKKLHQTLNKKEIQELRDIIAKLGLNNEELFKNWITHYKNPIAMRDAMRTHLVNEDEDENVNRIGNVITNRKGGMGEKQGIVYPFESILFQEQWKVWKDYRANEDGFKYKVAASEQAALSKLASLSKYDEATAIAIMHQSIANGWKGFFEENTTNGSTKQPSAKGAAGYSDNFKRKIAERLQSG